MNKCNKMGILMILVACVSLAGVAHAEIQIVNKDNLQFLADGMRVARSQLKTLRAAVRSTEVRESKGVVRIKRTSDLVPWISRGKEFRYDATESFTYYTETGDPIDKNAENRLRKARGKDIASKTGVSWLRERTISRSGSPDGVMELNSKRTNTAVIDRPEKLMGPSMSERYLYDPSLYGCPIMGLDLDDLMAGKFWRQKGTVDPMKELTISWDGTVQYEGQTVDVVRLDVHWKTKDGQQRARHYSIYIDPARGFTVPYIKGDYEQDGKTTPLEEVKVEMAQYGEERWGPKKITRKVFIGCPPTRSTTTTIEVGSFEANGPVTDEDLNLSLPPGIRIRDKIMGITYFYKLGLEEDVLSTIADSLNNIETWPSTVAKDVARSPILRKTASTTMPLKEAEALATGKSNMPLKEAEAPATGKSNWQIWMAIGTVVCAGLLGFVSWRNRYRNKTKGSLPSL